MLSRTYDLSTSVTGTFNTLEDDGETHCALTDAVYYW